MKDEQMEAWFESIESQLKQIRNNIPTQNDDMHNATKLLFEDFINRIRNLKFTVPAQDFSPITQKLDSVLNEAKRIGTPIRAELVRTEHYFFFFPDLKAWLFGLKRAKFVWVLSILLVCSLYYTWNLKKNYDAYHTSDTKLHYIRYKGLVPAETLIKVDSTWNVDLRFRKTVVKYVNDYETTAVQQQRILELETELKKLKK